MGTQSVAESKAERMIRAFMAGADRQMVAICGYGLTVEERAELELGAAAIYSEAVETVAA